MEAISQMAAFYTVIVEDARISTTHISLYMALLNEWSGSNSDPLQLTRGRIMRLAKISARQTFNKCMHQLSAYGYIRYIPATGPYQLSVIYILNLKTERM